MTTLPDFDDIERDQRTLAAISSIARKALEHSRKAIARAESEALEEADPLYRWVTRSAILEAALEVTQTYLVAIAEEAAP